MRERATRGLDRGALLPSTERRSSPPGAGRGYKRLRALSFTHSAIYAALLFCWLYPGLGVPTYVLGWCHGVMWIGMSLLCLWASRKRIIPFWLAVVVVVVGGLGPFAGTIAFIVHTRRVSLTS